MKRAARTFHLRFWLIFGVLIPLGFVALLLLKQAKPDNAQPVQLEAVD